MQLFRMLGEIAIEDREARKAIKNVRDDSESASSKMVGAFKKIGAAIASAFAIDRIIAFGKEIVNVAATVAAEQSAFQQIMGDYATQASEKVAQIAEATGMVDSRLTPYMTSMTAKFKGLGYDIDEATNYASRGLNLAADAAAFWDKSLDESMSHLNSFINGSYEGGEAIGLFANDTQMAAYAVQQGIVSTTAAWASLDEATKQATRLEYAENMMRLSGATGQAAKESTQYANVQANLNEKWRQFKAQIGEPLLQNLVLPAMKVLSSTIDTVSEAVKIMTGELDISKTKFAKFEPAINAVKNAFQILKAIFMPVIETIKQNIQDNLPKWKESFEKFKESLSALKPVFELISAVIVLAMGIIGGAVNGIISAVNGIIRALSGVIKYIGGFFELFIGLLTGNTEKINAGWKTMKQGTIDIFTGLWDALLNLLSGFIKAFVSFLKSFSNDVGGTWDAIKVKISTAVNSIKTIVSNVFNSIKSIVTSVFNVIKTIAASTWNGIKAAIETPINKARDTVKAALSKIQSFFNNLKLKFPNIKLPHFSIKGKLSLAPPSVPKLSVDWYKKAMNNAMLLNSPTIFGMNPSGQLMGGGEAGQEVVAGSSTLMNMIRSAVRGESNSNSYMPELITMLENYLSELINRSDKNLILDGDALVGQLTSKFDMSMGSLNKLKERGI